MLGKGVLGVDIGYDQIIPWGFFLRKTLNSIKGFFGIKCFFVDGITEEEYPVDWIQDRNDLNH